MILLDIYNKLLLIEEFKDNISMKVGTEESGLDLPINYIEFNFHKYLTWELFFEKNGDGNYYDTNLFINSENANITHYHLDKQGIITHLLDLIGNQVILRDKTLSQIGKIKSYKYQTITNSEFEQDKENYCNQDIIIFTTSKIIKNN